MTLQADYSATILAVIFMSRFGRAIQELREVAGYEKQGEAATASIKLAAEYPDFFQAFSQQWLSRLEADQAGDAIKKAQPLKIMALAYLLKLDSGEFYDRVGVAIAPVPLRERGAPEDIRRNGPPIPSVVPRLEVPLEIPGDLQEVIDTMGHKPGYEKLQSEKALRALTALRNYLGPEEGPQNADQWLEYFLDMRQWLPK